MISYFYPIDIPSTGSTGYYTEFTHEHHKTFVKAILQDDNNIVDRMVDNIIDSLIYEAPPVSSLNIFDKVYIMSAIRAYNISPKIAFVAKTTDGKPANIEVDLNTIVEALDTMQVSHSFTLQSDTDIKITGTLPQHFYYDNVLDIITGCISKIQLDSTRILDLTMLSKEERLVTVNSLPSTVFTEVFNFLKVQDEHISKNCIYKLDSQVELTGPSEIRLTLFNSVMLDYIKMLYNMNLRDFYLNEYSLANKFKMPIEFINKSTPAEIGMYYTIISDDLKKQEKEMQKQQNKDGVQLPGSGMSDGIQ